ncbi:MAG: hypothetical protein RLZZ103_1618, partial [Pseudomonadota bacterium]
AHVGIGQAKVCFDIDSQNAEDLAIDEVEYVDDYKDKEDIPAVAAGLRRFNLCLRGNSAVVFAFDRHTHIALPQWRLSPSAAMASRTASLRNDNSLSMRRTEGADLIWRNNAGTQTTFLKANTQQ